MKRAIIILLSILFVIANADDFMSAEPEESTSYSTLLSEFQNEEDQQCGGNQFVTIDANGALKCETCDKTTFNDEYTADKHDRATYKHGKCCVNSHHNVCKMLLKSFKQKCADNTGC